MTDEKHEALPEGATVVRWELTPEFCAREAWGPGEWENEPDLAEWRVPGSKLPRMVIRNHHGALCGYVGVPEGHPFHGKDYSADRLADLEVHGGLTYAAACGGRVCHVPAPGEPGHVWWLGFDCAHAWDVAPGLRLGLYGEERYRDIGYVIREVEGLAAQLEEVRGQ